MEGPGEELKKEVFRMARSDHPAHSHGQVGIKERHMSLADAPLLPVPGTDGVEIFHDHLQRELQKPGTGRWPAGTSRRPPAQDAVGWAVPNERLALIKLEGLKKVSVL